MKDLFLRLLTHEVQIALSSKCMSNETNHFMKLYSTINNWSKRREHTHVCIHLCIHQSERQCLITNKRLKQSKKKVVKKTVGCTRSVPNGFFKAEAPHHKWTTWKTGEESRTWLSVHELLPVDKEHPSTAEDRQVKTTLVLLVTAALYCVTCNHLGMIYIKSAVRKKNYLN